MSKEPRSFTIDEDVKSELQRRDEINASAVVNNYLREYLSATNTSEEEAMIQEIERQIDDIDGQIGDLRDKRDSLIQRRERIKDRMENKQEEQLESELKQYGAIPADPTHPEIQRIADDVDMSPEEVAKNHAEYHGKELKDETDGAKRGFQ